MNLIETLIKFLPELLKASLETLDMLSTSIIIGLIIGIPVGIYISLHRNIFSKVLSTIVNIVRSIPYIILIVLIMPITFYIVGISYGTQASKVPLSLISIALVVRVMETSLKSIPTQLFRVSKALGATKFQLIKEFIIKESLPVLILGITTTIISLLSYSTVMGVVAGGGLGDLALRHGLGEYNFNLLVIVIIIMIILVWIIQFTGNKIAFYFDKGKQ